MSRKDYELVARALGFTWAENSQGNAISQQVTANLMTDTVLSVGLAFAKDNDAFNMGMFRRAVKTHRDEFLASWGN